MLSNTEGMVINWQSGALTGCHVLLPTAQKCDIRAAVTLSHQATEQHIHLCILGEAQIKGHLYLNSLNSCPPQDEK